MRVQILLSTFLLLASANIICMITYIQQETSPSLSPPPKITPRPSRNGSLVHSSGREIKLSSARSLATIKHPPTPLLSPLRFPGCLTLPTESKIIEVLHFLFRQWLFRTGILWDKKNWAHSGHIFSLHPNIRDHKYMAADCGLPCGWSYFPPSFEHLW